MIYKGLYEFCDFCLAKLVAVVVGDASHSLEGKVAATVRLNVAGDEGGEVVDDKCLYVRIVEVAVNEGRQGGEPAVGQGLTINAVDNIGKRQLHPGLESGLGLIAQMSLIEGIEEAPAKNGTAALVAKDIAQGRRIGNDTVAVVETGVSPCSQNAGQALTLATESTGGTEKVAVGFYLGVRGER